MTIPLQTPAGTAPPIVGILGGGQLGRMMAPAAHRLGVQLYALDPQGSASPFGQLGYPCLEGSFADEAKLRELAKHCDVITVEIEHVNAQALKKLQDSGSVTVHPAPDTIALIQDKLQQKRFFQDKSGVEVAPFSQVSSLEDARKVGQDYGYPYMLKSRRDAYDGKGNAVVHSADDMESAFQSLGIKDTTATDLLLYAEKWVPFTKELAVMVVKQDDQVKAYPVVETAQENSVCATVLAPAHFQSQSTYDQAIHMALSAIDCLEGNGIYGVELFLTKNNGEEKVYLNEIAPRPHNSGHYTIEACATDQFEQHVRAVSGLPLGSCDLKVGASLMVNVLGDPSGHEKSSFAILQQSLTIPGAIPHFYGKQGVRPGRKLGHVTLVADDLGELRTRASQLVENVPDTTPGVASLRQVTALPSQDDLVGIKAGAKVGIVMGSDSDLSTMQAAAKVLDQFGVPYELTIVSAHRTAHRMYQYAETAAGRGLHVIIAGAGGAAHLPGMIAAITPLPVVGVPVKTSTLNGEDSLLSIVQMPRGVPVATVAIGNAMNAGLLAVRMLGGKYIAKMQQFLEDQKDEVDRKIEKLASIGWEQYLAQ